MAYRGHLFRVGVIVAERIRVPEARPDPLELDAAVVGDTLELALENVSENSRTMHLPGRPYFGVLVGIGVDATDPATLAHDEYEDNEGIVVDDDFTFTDTAARRGIYELLELEPGDAIEETYRLPPDLREEHSVWFSMRAHAEEDDQWVGIWTLEFEAGA